MEVLYFIFGLGIAFSIFGFLWGMIMLLVSFVTRSISERTQVQFYVLRIVKYFFLVSVIANYIIKYEAGSGGDNTVAVSNMVVGTIVLALYLLGKLQKRTLLNQFSKNRLVSMLAPPIDPKVERYLLSGSIVYFVFCLQYPVLVDNAVVNWFTESIVNIYDTPIFGWIFALIAFFFLINIIFRGANVIGSLLTGQPINSPGGGIGGRFSANMGGSNPFEQFRQQQQNDEEFVDYEDVTDQDDDGSTSENDSNDENRLN